jgi:predicted MFS family arabinose efflux permease
VTTPPPPPTPSGVRAGTRRDPFLVTVVALAVALAVADSSVVVLALPDLYSTFDVSIVGVSWTITAYNVAIVIGALAVLPLEQRLRGHVIAATGLGVFSVASLACGLANSFPALIVGRSVQGVGAALALAGTVPVLAGIRGSDARAIATWGMAGTIGVALGPALGGLLTQLFSWRSIFLLQAPLAALALVAVADGRVRAVEIHPRRERVGRTWLANGGFLLLYGALVGALFLAVLLLVVLWGWEPLTGAIIVSGLPLGAIVVRRLGMRLASRPAAVTGGVALAGGLVALGFLPGASAGWVVPALFACGLGLGLLGGVLAPAAIPPAEANVRAATVSIAARHAGFVLGLAIIAPVLAGQLDTAALEATRATTAELLDADISLRTKVDLALDLRDLVADAPRGEVPDPTVPFDERGADDDDGLAHTRDGVVAAIRDTLTRAFRSSFVIAALLGAGAALVAAALPAFHNTVARHDGADANALAIAGGIIVLVGGLVIAELRAGAHDYGTREYVAPCDAPADPFPQGSGLDGTLQRIALSAVNGAACELGTGREELILSLERRSDFGPEVTWTQENLEKALRAGLVRAIDDADDRDTIPGLVASGLEAVAKRAPIDWILGRFDIPFLED